MSTNPQRIVVPNRSRVYLAAVGTVAPVDATVALGTAWKEVGLTTEDNLSFEESPQFQDVRSAQSDFPTRSFQTQDSATVQADLQEWSADNFKSVYGGGDVVVAGSAQWKYTPPALGGRTEVAVIVEIVDGIKHYRFVYPRCLQREGVTMALNKTSEAKLPMKLTVLGGDGTSPWYLLTDDPGFSVA